MATAEHHDTGAAERAPRTYAVVLQLPIAGPIERATLEDLMNAISEAVEEHAAEIALGVVGSATYEPARVELDFDIEAPTLSAVHQRIAQIIEIIEQHTAGFRLELEASSQARPAEPELVPC